MLYKLYKAKNKTTEEIYDYSFEGFSSIYKKYDVQVLGGGTNVDDTSEMYLMVVYKDKKHYEETVKKLQADPTYIELSKKLQEQRESIEVITLESSYEY
ncbi:MAG: hypothetical protein HGN29_08400 [Asgard group archaeon]|nr:hypothetical protein [Asgard group archaeon]